MSKEATNSGSTPGVGATDGVIIALVLSAAAIHFSRALVNPHIAILFTLNGLGYLACGVMLYLPMLEHWRNRIRQLLLGYAALTLLLFCVWGFMKGEWLLIGFICGGAELLLIGLLGRQLAAPRR